VRRGDSSLEPSTQGLDAIRSRGIKDTEPGKRRQCGLLVGEIQIDAIMTSVTRLLVSRRNGYKNRGNTSTRPQSEKEPLGRKEEGKGFESSRCAHFGLIPAFEKASEAKFAQGSSPSPLQVQIRRILDPVSVPWRNEARASA
jgi:hypothetical protein